MGNTIQNYYLHDLSSYSKSIKLNISIDELNRRQTEERKGAFAAVAQDDAATIEISELARTMYNASSASGKAKNEDTLKEPVPAAEPEKTKEEQTTPDPDRYAGLSGTERELKELEDYIASHPADTSIDLLRNGSLVQQAGRSATNLVDEEFLAAGEAYTKALGDAAEGFANFSMKVTYGAYSSNDVSAKDLDFSALDKMEDVYRSFKEQIQSAYEGDEREKYLSRLDEAYNTVFEEKVISPVKGAYDDKLFFFKPDDEETVKSIRAASASREGLNAMVSGYLANQAVNKKQYDALTDGTKDFYSLANNKSLWHDTAAVKSVLTDTMDAYASVKEVHVNDSAYLSEKSAADKIAKQISDKYAETLAYKADKIGFKKDGEETEWSRLLDAAITDTSSGMFMIDFSKIAGLESIMG